jgi:hypothetical protein
MAIETDAAGFAATRPDAVAAAPKKCEDSCTYLADAPTMADAAAMFDRECPVKWPGIVAGDSCDGYQYAINCVYAAYGYVFKKPEWQDRFTAKAWYRPRPEFQESDLSANTKRIIANLRDADKQCKLDKQPMSDADRALAVDTYNKARNGDLESMPGISDDNREEFFEFFGSLAVGEDTNVAYELHTPTDKMIRIDHFQYETKDGSGGYEDARSIVLSWEGKRLIEITYE